MKTTKTSEAIAKRMRERMFLRQTILQSEYGYYVVTVSGIREYTARATTITGAYRDIERMWKDEQSK